MATKTATKKDNFAVIETGSKQYRVSVGDIVTIEKLSGDLKTGDIVTFDKVILMDDGKELKLGAPVIEGAKVEAEYVSGGKGKKISVIKYKAKSRYFKNRGHRQPFAKVKITSIK